MESSKYLPADLSPVVNDGRRRFISQLIQASGLALLAGLPADVLANNNNHAAEWTVGGIMDRFIAEVPGAPFEKTVDTLKSGKRENKVTGVVTTMFPTVAVIKRAIELQSNFIICHEPSFYNHQDETEWLKNDPVYQSKRELIDKNGITIWRNHDYIHRHSPDGVLTGVIRMLAWENNFERNESKVKFERAQKLRELIQYIKFKMNIGTLRYVGDLEQVCNNALVLPGAYGGRLQISLTSAKQPDVVICGEVSEWEMAEYVRDANQQGRKLSLIILGHVASEEPGSIYMQEWLQKAFPGLPVHHVPAQNPLSFL